MTTKTVLVLGSEDLYREWGYTALSRGQTGNRLYLTVPGSSEREEFAPATHDKRDPLQMAITALGRSRAELLATDTARRPEHYGRNLTVDPPRYLTATLGPIPERISARRWWEHAAVEIESYRERFAIDDPDRALGSQPTDLRQRAAWRELRRQIDRTSRSLDAPEREPGRAIER